MLIGYSLSLCIKAIIKGEVRLEEVDHIEAATKATTEADWDRVIDACRQVYWVADPDEGERIARLLIAQGKVKQPRLRGEPYADLPRRGIWGELVP